MRVDSICAESLCRSQRRLIQIALKLLVQRVTSNIGDVCDGIEANLAFHGDVPGVGLGLRGSLADRA